MTTVSPVSKTPEPAAQAIAQRGANFPRRILACLSLSPRTAAIAAEAWTLAQTCGAACHFLHIGAGGQGAQAHLAQALKQAGVPDDHRVSTQRGPLREVIEQTVARHQIDLIVAGVLRERTTLSRHFCSVAGRIAAAAPCSVLLLTNPQLQRRPIERVVASVDFDDLSRDMLSDMLAWGECEGTEQWHVVHEYDPTGFYSPLDGVEPESRASRTRRLGEFVGPPNWSGRHLHRLCLVNKHGCDAIWYAQTIRADVLCLPLSMRRQAFWERVLRFRLDVDIEYLPHAVMLYRNVRLLDDQPKEPDA